MKKQNKGSIWYFSWIKPATWDTATETDAHTHRENKLPTHQSISLMIATTLLPRATTTPELLIYEPPSAASHFHPRLSSLELSAWLRASLLLLGRKAKSWLANHITTTSQRRDIWQVWEIPRFLSSGESGWIDGRPPSPLSWLVLLALLSLSFLLLSFLCRQIVYTFLFGNFLCNIPLCQWLTFVPYLKSSCWEFKGSNRAYDTSLSPWGNMSWTQV